MTTAATEPATDQARSSVLDRAAALLTSFAPGDAWVGPAELGRRAGLPRPTAYRLALQLTRHGLLEHHNGAFRLGTLLFELGHRVAGVRTLRQRAAPLMTRLRDRTGYTVHLAELAGHDVLYLDIVPGAAGPVPPSRVGGRLPAHATGVGKMLLAYAPTQLVDALLSRPLPRLTPHTIVQPGRLRPHLTAIAARGTATDLEECLPGLACAAAPVLTDKRTAIAALSVSARSIWFDTARAQALVRAAAADLTRELANGGIAAPGRWAR